MNDTTWTFLLTNDDRGVWLRVGDFPDKTAAWNAGLERLRRLSPHSWDHSLQHEGWRLQVAEGTPFPYAGTVSHGTCRTEDLLPRFVQVATGVLDWFALQPFSDHPDSVALVGSEHRTLGAIEARIEDDGDGFYIEGEDSIEDLQKVEQMIGDLAPDALMFCTHEGDGSDWGFWPVGGDE